MKLRTIISCIVATALALPGASAQSKRPDASGSWDFKSEPMGYGCVLSGDMTVSRTSDKSYKCTFEASWSCKLRLPRSVQTEQSCIATQTGDNVTITSRMTRINKVDPADMLDMMQKNYAADHFTLKINARGDEMDGIFKSYGQAPVKFRKRLDLIG